MRKEMRAYDKLLLEEQQLEEELKLHRQQMADKWQHLKASVQPAVIGMQLAQNALTRAKTNNTVLNTGVNFAIDLVVKKWLLRKSGWMMKMMVPFVLKNITSNVIQKKIEKK
jgi:hypothetical protein